MSLEYFITLIATLALLAGYAIGRTDRIYKIERRIIEGLLKNK